jgi:tellurite resistance-related uncharacterized protein
MSVRIFPILTAATFIAGFGIGDYLAKQEVLGGLANTEGKIEYSEYEKEMLARSSHLLVMQEQIAMMLLQERGEIPYQRMLATEEEVAAVKAELEEQSKEE